MKKKQVKRSKRELRQVGALWVRETDLGKEYMSGLLDGRPVVIFENKFRTDKKHPFWIVFEEAA